MTMGTASTMTSAAEVLGLTLPGFSSIPAPDSRHAQMATLTGKRIVDMVWEDLKPSDVLTEASFDNAVTTVLALSGSSNAVVHLIAMARRAGLTLDLDRFDTIARRTPVLANIRPAGKYLMEDFFYAGGLRALLVELGDLIDGSTLNVNGSTLAENIAGAKVFNADVIRSRAEPLVESDGLVVLYGNLAPRGAVMKPPAADPSLLAHTGRAVVFTSYDGHGGPHRRSRARRGRVVGARAPERRAARRPGHAGVGPAAHSEEAARGRACATCCASPTRA